MPFLVIKEIYCVCRLSSTFLFSSFFPLMSLHFTLWHYFQLFMLVPNSQRTIFQPVHEGACRTSVLLLCQTTLYFIAVMYVCCPFRCKVWRGARRNEEEVKKKIEEFRSFHWSWRGRCWMLKVYAEELKIFAMTINFESLS